MTMMTMMSMMASCDEEQLVCVSIVSLILMNDPEKQHWCHPFIMQMIMIVVDPIRRGSGCIF